MNVWIKQSRNQLILFFLLAFILAWGTWIPAFVLPQFPKQLSLIGLFAPAISALIVAALSRGKRGVTELLGRYKIWKFGIQWYFLAIFLLPFIYLLAILINALFFQFPLHNILVGSPLYFILAAFIWLMVINSGEEIGWRGFALPTMLKSMKNPVWVNVVLSIIWGLWHLPIYLTPGQSAFPYPLFLVLIFGLTFIYTSLFIKTKGSLLPAVILHAGTDIGPRIFQIAHFTIVLWSTVDILVILVAIIMFLRQKGASKII